MSNGANSEARVPLHNHVHAMQKPFDSNFFAALPVKVYLETLLEDITTREDLLPAVGPTGPKTGAITAPRAFPSGFSAEPNQSFLPFSKTNVERAISEGELRVTDRTMFYKDASIDKNVYLAVHNVTTIMHPRDRHWGLRWKVTHRHGPTKPDAVRCLEVFDNVKRNANAESKYLINFGPVTSDTLFVHDPQTPVYLLLLGMLSLPQRLALEQIAWNVGVVARPDGEFNCQNWAAAVLSVAAARGIVSQDKVLSVLQEALKGTPEVYVKAYEDV